MAIDPVAPLTLEDLEEHLGRSADLFRYEISNQKDYVLALPFSKCALRPPPRGVRPGVDEEFPGVPEDAAVAIIEANPKAYHSILIPKGHFWEVVRNATRTSSARRSTTP